MQHNPCCCCCFLKKMNNKKYDDDDDSINEVRLKLKIYYLKIEINLAHIKKRKIRRIK